MALHNIRGGEGERLAANYVERNGFDILFTNWRYSYYETDIIASRCGVLHFIEVKTRHTDTFGYPEEAVTKKKFENLKKCAEFFLQQYPQWKTVQFDVLSIMRYKNRIPEYLLFE